MRESKKQTRQTKIKSLIVRELVSSQCTGYSVRDEEPLSSDHHKGRDRTVSKVLDILHPFSKSLLLL